MVAQCQAGFERLTAREREVFAHVAAGRLNKQTAVTLGISEKTVKVHRARVMEKMQAGSLAELVRMADSLGIAMPRDFASGIALVTPVDA